MKRKLFIKLGAISTVATMPMIAASCGQDVKTAAKLEQESLLKSQELMTKIENQWRLLTLAKLYKVEVTNAEDISKYVNEFNNVNSQLYKDSYEAFKIYAIDKMTSDPYYFTSKKIEWTKAQYFTDEQLKTLGYVQSNVVPNEETFKIFWNVEKTNLRSDIEKMLLVKAYFDINTVEELKKIDTNFKDNSTRKYELEHYNLIKYAADNKYAQVWKKSTTTASTNDDFFIHGYNIIKDASSFNAFLKDTTDATKTISNTEIITKQNEELQKTLQGYAGVIKNPEYSLQWSYDNLKNKKVTDTYGFYDANNEKLLNYENTPELATNGYNPYKNNSSTNNEAVVVYLNQITPIGAAEEVELPISEDNKENVEKVRLLTFNNTIYKDNLNELAYMFLLKDSTLSDVAINAFAKLGYKIKIDKNIAPELQEALKDKPYIEA